MFSFLHMAMADFPHYYHLAGHDMALAQAWSKPVDTLLAWNRKSHGGDELEKSMFSETARVMVYSMNDTAWLKKTVSLIV
jgi:hypothetical protein